MRPRASHLLLLIDYAVGLFAVLAVTALVVGFLVITGPPKRYEAQAIGVAYAKALFQIEGSARELRAEFCANLDAETAADAKCPPQSGDDAGAPTVSSR